MPSGAVAGLMRSGVGLDVPSVSKMTLARYGWRQCWMSTATSAAATLQFTIPNCDGPPVPATPTARPMRDVSNHTPDSHQSLAEPSIRTWTSEGPTSSVLASDRPALKSLPVPRMLTLLVANFVLAT